MDRHAYDLGLIGNCNYLALIGTDTDVKWMCLPRFDSSFVFGGLLDEKKGGGFSIRPDTEAFDSKQYYIENTNVLVTEITTKDGAYRVTDFAPRFYQYDRYYRPAMFIRKVEVISGLPKVRVICEPVTKYGEEELRKERGSTHIRYYGMEETLRLSTDVPLSYIQTEKAFNLSRTHYLVLTYGAPLEAGLTKTAEHFLQETIAYWQGWVKSTSIGDLYQKEVIRSSLALKIHQYEDTGAVIASPTTSLPESPGSTRNWDYRFCWMRDTFYTLTAFNNIGHFEEMEKYFLYLTDITTNAGDRIQPLYSITGFDKLEENELPLCGYQGEQPVRIGNDAYTHIQNDVYGQILLAILPLYADQRFIDHAGTDTLGLVTGILDRIERTMDEPDAGLWEFRNKQQHHTYTYLFQWAGSAAAKKIFEQTGHTELAKKAESLMERAKVYIDKAYDQGRGVYTQAIGTKHLDASTLQLILMGFIDPASEEAHMHIAALEKELHHQDGLFYRYKHEDDFGTPETTFMICAFWYVEALAAVGRLEEAMAYFENLCSYSNHVGLLSEDVHGTNGSQWGNFPQAYSHVGLVNAAYRIHKVRQRASFL